MDKIIAVQLETAEKVTKGRVNFKKTPKDRMVLGYVEARLEALEKYWTTFSDNHDELVGCVAWQNRGEVPYFKNEVFEELEELYYTYKGELKTVLSTLNQQKSTEGGQSSKSATSAVSPPPPEVKLPRITIPTFSGSYTEWQSFHDLFIALIHNNKSLEKVQKLHYLKSNLSGEAEALLRQFSITGDNYEEAWAILKKRYSNKRYIANCIFKRLFSQKTLTQESAQALKQLLDTTVECINALKNQGLPVQHWDAIVVYIIVAKLDNESHKQWEETVSGDGSETLPSFDKLKEFLETRFRTMEMIESSNKGFKPTKPKSFHTTAVTTQPQCAFCNEAHYICHCKKFTQLSVDERYNFVQKGGLCFNCLIPNHSVYNCKQTSTCRICNRKHHSLLHTDKKRINYEKQDEENRHKDQEEKAHVSSHFSIHEQPGQHVLLATALVDVPSGNGKIHVFRALVDQGSQAAFVTENMVQSLGLKRERINGVVSGIGEGNKSIKYLVDFTLKSRNDPTFTLKVQAYVLTALTTYLPSTEVELHWKKLESITLADPTFNTPSKIDILLGAAEYSKIIESGLIKGPSGIIAQATHLGWILSGETSTISAKEERVVSLHTQILDNDLLKKFWEIDNESYTNKPLLTKDEELCEHIYEETTERDETGRYVVQLPLKENLETVITNCGNTKQIAVKRFLQLERQLVRNDKLKTEYAKVMKEYEELGHMEIANDTDDLALYLPHHAVIREDKETTKVRVVFDASSKGYNGSSLNEHLLVGPVLQPDLRTLLIKWRTHRICIVADIIKMYRQVRVAPQHTDLQRIIWRDDPKKDIASYKLLRVTFGTASAPYLAVKTLQKLANDEQKKYSIAAKIVKDSFYMDDLMTGAENLEEAKMVYHEVNELLKMGGFETQKWSSNSTELLDTIQKQKGVDTSSLEIKMDKVIKILGLTWVRDDDMFKFTVHLPENDSPPTKRSILSQLTRLFDPFGWLAPVLITAKILIQKLWLSGADWDQELPLELAQEWIDFRNNLHHLELVSLNRWFNTSSTNTDTELHGFADASMAAYAAVAYLKTVDQDGAVHIRLIAAKSRVAPLKQISVPRLELCAATLLTKLLNDLATILKIEKARVFAWTDSTIVLAWLQSHPSKWQTFVANRVSEIIQVLDNTSWRHVKSAENPADLPSRGISAQELVQSELWWQGPSWLKEKVDTKKPTIPETEIEKRKISNRKPNTDKRNKILVLHANTNKEKMISESEEEKPFWEKYSTLNKVKRVVACCRRIITRKQLTEEDDPTILNAKELNEALETCVRYYQNKIFSEEIQHLQKQGKVLKKSSLASLSPFLDTTGVLRVGGRLQNAHIKYNERHPYIIPGGCYLAALIVQEAHHNSLHGGNQLTSAVLRSQYHIMNEKREVKQFIRRCVVCTRHKAKTGQQMMGQLPACRVNPARAFENSGVDYAGPIQIRMSKGRGYKSTKGYICLFVCMVTRAVHIEAVTDMTTNAFLAAFRRFVARRGHCKHLWSDNGSNFIGAAKELKQLLQKGEKNISREIAKTLSNTGTTWHFIPPRSPNFGGLWEAAVKSVKGHLTRVIGESTLTYEEMATLLAQIEACLNSRPLCRDMTASDILTPLTPGHFLIGDSLVGIPEPNQDQENINLMTRWQLVQRMTQHFWQRWRAEYLHTLQHRYKWKDSARNPEKGDVVILKDENLPPTKWLLGRIVEVHPGKDNKVRVVTVQCKNNTFYTRPLSKIVMLPIEL